MSERTETERLDWMEKESVGGYLAMWYAKIRERYCPEATNFRQAIDAAIDAEELRDGV